MVLRSQASSTESAVDLPRIMQHRFADFDAMTESIPDFDSQYVRLATGTVDTQFTRVALDRVLVLRCDERVPKYVFRATAPPAPSLAFPLDLNPHAVWGGTPIDDTTLVHYGPGAEVVGRSSGAMSWASIIFDQEVLDRHAARLGMEIAPRTSSAQLLAPDPAAMAALRRAARGLFAIADSAHAVLEMPEVRRFQEEKLLTALVHAAGAACEGREAVAMSHRRVVLRALEVLEKRCDEAVYLAELCGAAGVSERTLRTAFQRIHGVSPIRYLHMHRMGQAHRALRDADRSRERVADIATRFGFANLGRFAVEFRQLFGVSPSQVLRSAR